jgi:hypothetical protein
VRLSQIAESAGLYLAIDNDIPRPGGDPLDLVRSAIRRAKEQQAKRGSFDFRALLLDRDKLGVAPERDEQISKLARVNRLHLIWQRPCHEGFLLRHLEGHENTSPPTTDLASQALKRIWTDYHKPMSAIHLASRIDLQAVLRACSVESSFKQFLDQIGLR